MYRYFTPAALAVSGSLAVLNPALADQGHQHGHDQFQTDSPTYTHGAETGNVRTGDNAIEVYGRLYLALAYNDHGGDEESSENLLLTSEGSRLGFRGNKKLSETTKLFWQIESSIDLDNLGEGGHDDDSGNSSVLAGNDSFLGISGSAGTILGGKHMTPFWLTAHSWDPFPHIVGSSLAMLGKLPNIGNELGDHHGTTMPLRAPNTVLYYSPSFNGFTIAAGLIAIDQRSAENGVNAPAPSISLDYKNGDFSFVYAYESHKDLDLYSDQHDDPAPDLIGATDAHRLGAMYHFPTTMVSVILERMSIADVENNALEDSDRTAFQVGVQQKVGEHSLRFSYQQAGEFQQNDGATIVTLGWFHKLSKETHAYLAAAMVNNDAEANYGTFVTGDVEHGDDPLTVAVGAIHNF